MGERRRLQESPCNSTSTLGSMTQLCTALTRSLCFLPGIHLLSNYAAACLLWIKHAVRDGVFRSFPMSARAQRSSVLSASGLSFAGANTMEPNAGATGGCSLDDVRSLLVEALNGDGGMARFDSFLPQARLGAGSCVPHAGGDWRWSGVVFVSTQRPLLASRYFIEAETVSPQSFWPSSFLEAYILLSTETRKNQAFCR